MVPFALLPCSVFWPIRVTLVRLFRSALRFLPRWLLKQWSGLTSAIDSLQVYVLSMAQVTSAKNDDKHVNITWKLRLFSCFVGISRLKPIASRELYVRHGKVACTQSLSVNWHLQNTGLWRDLRYIHVFTIFDRFHFRFAILLCFWPSGEHWTSIYSALRLLITSFVSSSTYHLLVCLVNALHTVRTVLCITWPSIFRSMFRSSLSDLHSPDSSLFSAKVTDVT